MAEAKDAEAPAPKKKKLLIIVIAAAVVVLIIAGVGIGLNGDLNAWCARIISGHSTHWILIFRTHESDSPLCLGLDER